MLSTPDRPRTPTANHPEITTDSLPTNSRLLPPEDRVRVLQEWNRTEIPFPSDTRLHDAFESQAFAQPDAEALIVGHERLTYGELNRRANRIAHHLRRLGVGPETPVGLFLPRTSDLICALLGVLKSGGAYVPLDPSYPAERLTFILQDAQVKTVLTYTSLAGALHELTNAEVAPLNTVCLDLPDTLADTPDENLAPLAQPHHLAYIIYTSGSTGRPKGVCIEHRNAVAFTHWCGRLYGPEEIAGVVATATICFDASVLEIFTPLSFGGKLILAENALAVPSLPAANEIRLMDTVPSAVRELLRVGGLPTSLQTINLGGEAVPDDLVRALYALPHIKRVYDQYGPTETTVVATCGLRDPDEPGTIGRPIDNYRAYLLNDRLEPVAVGELGDLYIGGAGVARGYLHRPELTARKFIPDPFSATPGARMYRTGDLCRYKPDGRLRFVGRADLQVKIRGFRIELGEIENALAASSAVHASTARVWTEPDGAKKLVAYVVPKPGVALPERDLREHLRSRLPEYMVPASFVFLERLPLTPNGKIDAQALPAPSTRRPDLSTPFSAPRTLLERNIAAAWSRVLQIDPVGLDDRFMELGGDSLRLVKIHREIAAFAPRAVSITDLFQFPTVRSLAAHLEKPATSRTSKVAARARLQNSALRTIAAGYPTILEFLQVGEFATCTLRFASAI